MSSSFDILRETAKVTNLRHPLQQNEIRLVRLKSAPWGAPIMCELNSVDINEPPPVLHFDPKRDSPVKEKNASRRSGACEAFRFFVELNEDHEQCVGLFEKLCKSCRQISRRSFMAASTRSLVSIASAFNSKIPLPMPTLEACWIS
ncbi:hypothetical protein IG631_15093 [Alternaria alternata]|nr:hypothetical protein IG631_15093 [Alternaria alternata]